MGESHHDNFGKVHYSREKSNNESFTGNSKHRSLTCNYCHKKGHIRADYRLQKKKQPDINITELIGEEEEQCDILSITGRSVGNKDRWIIDSEYLQHIFFSRKMFSSYTSIQEGEVFMRNFATSMIGE